VQSQKKFILTRKNQKGQVAIFVALIFQVVFVFFAVLINVGLLVHHKINLQQSTDLAAYYGAMKQSELMNAISHVNFQMRQAWKLLTWRYRIVGTFGFQKSDNIRPQLVFPLDISLTTGIATRYQADADTKCASTGVSILDVPFFCAGHIGMGDWPATNENNCRVDCKHIEEVASSIAAIPLTGGYDNGYTGGVAAAVNVALNSANSSIENLCKALGPQGFRLMTKFILSYGNEVQQKKKLIQLLGANLSAAPEAAVDLEGGLIKEGSQKTFDNNLTEANKTGKISFDVMNGLAGNSCSFNGNSTDGEANSGQFLKEIEFKAIQFFMHYCAGQQNTNKDFQPISIYGDANFNSVNPKLLVKLVGSTTVPMSASEIEPIKNGILGTKYIIGYEKNPWCQVYYGVKAQSEPKIPFLPISKIKLSATAFAKPFGGSIGPRYFSNWTAGQTNSDSGPKVDATLPLKNPTAAASLVLLQKAVAILPNYANFVGDEKGLKDPLLAATYQDILLHRQINLSETGTLHISQNKESGGEAPNNLSLSKATFWPANANWNNLADPSANNYDYLASAIDPNKNSFLRDLEISVLAPNQFDLTYYSIDSDYFNNYYLKLIGGTAGPLTFAPSLNKMKSAVGGFGPDASEIKPDYGFNKTLQDSFAIANNYSVRHQIAVASKIIKATQHKAINFPADVARVLRFIPDNLSSLLTGWTFQNFSDFDTFPTAGPDAQNTMTFGKCNDQEWNHTGDSNSAKVYDSPVSKNFPPTPGNCVWGGRTGYSVKLVSPSVLRANAPPQPYGGNGTSGNIVNPAKDEFFEF
jgi:hypothetical protein